jgi:hypothetical protein
VIDDQEQYTLEDAHREFGKRFNGRVWELLSKAERSPEEEAEMEMAATASLYHWRHVGRELHGQRGEWLLAHVYHALGRTEEAVLHAGRCYDLTEAYREQMEDFDIAYGYETMARAKAAVGEKEAAESFLAKAEAAGAAIGDVEDKEIFMGDFNGGPWYGLR